jgi:hypothetical protein
VLVVLLVLLVLRCGRQLAVFGRHALLCCAVLCYAMLYVLCCAGGRGGSRCCGTAAMPAGASNNNALRCGAAVSESPSL